VESLQTQLRNLTEQHAAALSTAAKLEKKTAAGTASLQKVKAAQVTTGRAGVCLDRQRTPRFRRDCGHVSSILTSWRRERSDAPACGRLDDCRCITPDCLPYCPITQCLRFVAQAASDMAKGKAEAENMELKAELQALTRQHDAVNSTVM
jgi:hypothetical protein